MSLRRGLRNTGWKLITGSFRRILHFLRGGRVSKTAGFIGGVLNICPLLNVSNKGELIVRDKIRTKKKGYKGIAG